MIFSLHMEKCAGTSLREWLEKRLTLYHFNPYYFEKEVKEIKEQNPEIVHGHFRYGFHSGFNAPAKYFTFLRDPVDRFVSQFHHISTRFDHSLFPIVNGLTVDDFLDHPDSSIYDNWYCSRLNTQSAATALVLLDSFIYVGITEQIQKSVDELANHLNVKRGTIGKLNKRVRTKSYPEINKETRKKIEERNEADIEVYRKVLEW